MSSELFYNRVIQREWFNWFTHNQLLNYAKWIIFEQTDSELRNESVGSLILMFI